MKCRILIAVLICSFLTPLKAQPTIALVEFSSGFEFPVDITNAGDERMFIVERKGYIKITDMLGNVLPNDFLDIHEQVESGYQEQGLLGLAFHPDYASNGFFYVNYIDLDGNTVVSRFTVSAVNPDSADIASELILFTADQPFTNHNGGCLKFGPDGYLYIGLGDGGSAGDPGNRAQNPENKLGKMHRIDVNGATPYAIPTDNPFATATDTLQEIWAIGYRNPWRFSFDQLTGNMWIGDVGQNLFEEINVEPAGSGGHNYGWKCYEGFSEFDTDDCEADSTYVFPILDYPHNFTTGGFSISGGFVYRGTEYPGMTGYYLSADYVSGNWWRVNADGGLPWIYSRMDDIASSISSFGEDINAEMYCADYDAGIIYHITDACGDFVISTAVTDYACGVNDGAVDLTVTAGEAPYTYDWTDGSETEDISGLLPGMYTVVVMDNTGCERSERVNVNEIPAFVVNISVSGNILTADAGTSWQWYLNGIEIPGAIAVSYTATENGSYSVLATDVNGCSVLSEEMEFVLTAVFEIENLNAVTLFPNPAADMLNIRFLYNGLEKDALISVYDITGSKIAENKFPLQSGENLFQINLKTLQSGMYNLNLKVGNDNLFRYFVK